MEGCNKPVVDDDDPEVLSTKSGSETDSSWNSSGAAMHAIAIALGKKPRHCGGIAA
jgi:hypothetical protein